jgi:hypothetical protein
MRNQNMIIFPCPLGGLLFRGLPFISDQHAITARDEFIPLVPILKPLIFKHGFLSKSALSDIEAHKRAPGGYPIIDIDGPQKLPI